MIWGVIVAVGLFVFFFSDKEFVRKLYASSLGERKTHPSLSRRRYACVREISLSVQLGEGTMKDFDFTRQETSLLFFFCKKKIKTKNIKLFGFK